MALQKSDLSAAITAHFNSLKNQWVEVPEWITDGKPAVVFFDPLTVAERIELDQHKDDFYARVLIKKACKPDGTKYFTLVDLPMLMTSASPLVLVSLANRILNADSVDPRLLGEYSPPGAKTGSSSG